MKRILILLFIFLFVTCITKFSYAQTASSQDSVNLLRDIFSIFMSPGSQPSTGSSSPSGTTNPQTIPLDSSPITTTAEQFKNQVANCKNNLAIYQQASAATGIDWKVLAGIHFIEGGCGANSSLVSGRAIGTNEPDVVRTQGCSSMKTGPGEPIPIGANGCGFSSLLDSAIYAGRHLIGKIGRTPTTLEDFALALARYNGMGNSNCGKTPYEGCPPAFTGDDHIYPMNLIDSKHEKMYLVYCADFTPCNPPRLYTRPGVLAIMKLLETLQ